MSAQWAICFLPVSYSLSLPKAEITVSLIAARI